MKNLRITGGGYKKKHPFSPPFLPLFFPFPLNTFPFSFFPPFLLFLFLLFSSFFLSPLHFFSSFPFCFYLLFGHITYDEEEEEEVGISLCVFSLTKEKKTHTQGNKQVRRTRKAYIFIKKEEEGWTIFERYLSRREKKKKRGRNGGEKGI